MNRKSYRLPPSARKALNFSMSNMTPIQMTTESLSVSEDALSLDDVLKIQAIYPETTLSMVQNLTKRISTVKNALKDAKTLDERSLDPYLGKSIISGSSLSENELGLITVHLAMEHNIFLVLPDTLMGKHPRWDEPTTCGKSAGWVDRGHSIRKPEDLQINMQKAASFLKLIKSMNCMKDTYKMLNGRYKPYPPMDGEYLNTSITIMPEEIPNLLGGRPNRANVLGVGLPTLNIRPMSGQQRFMEHELTSSLKTMLAEIVGQGLDDPDKAELFEDALDCRFGFKYGTQWVPKVGDKYLEPKFHRMLGKESAYLLTAANDSDRQTLEQCLDTATLRDSNLSINVKAREASLIATIMECLNVRDTQINMQPNNELKQCFADILGHHPVYSDVENMTYDHATTEWKLRIPVVPWELEEEFWPNEDERDSAPPDDMNVGGPPPWRPTRTEYSVKIIDIILEAGLEIYQAILTESSLILEEEAEIYHNAYAGKETEVWTKVMELFYPGDRTSSYRPYYKTSQGVESPLHPQGMERARDGDWSLKVKISTKEEEIERWMDDAAHVKKSKEEIRNKGSDTAIKDGRAIALSNKTWNGTINEEKQKETLKRAIMDILKMVDDDALTNSQMKRFKNHCYNPEISEVDDIKTTMTKLGIAQVTYLGKSESTAFKWRIELEMASAVSVRARAKLLVNFLNRADMNTKAVVEQAKTTDHGEFPQEFNDRRAKERAMGEDENHGFSIPEDQWSQHQNPKRRYSGSQSYNTPRRVSTKVHANSYELILQIYADSEATLRRTCSRKNKGPRDDSNNKRRRARVISWRPDSRQRRRKEGEKEKNRKKNRPNHKPKII